MPVSFFGARPTGHLSPGADGVKARVLRCNCLRLRPERGHQQQAEHPLNSLRKARGAFSPRARAGLTGVFPIVCREFLARRLSRDAVHARWQGSYLLGGRPEGAPQFIAGRPGL